MGKPSPAMIVALLALSVALGGVGVAATGGNFILGQSNGAGDTTQLTSGVSTGPTLSLSNTGGRPAAKFTANSNVQPFSVGSATKVGNLNADRLDGEDSTNFLPSTGLVTVSYSHLDFIGGSPFSFEANNVFVHVSSSSAGTYNLAAVLDRPVSIFGKALKVKSVQICYSAIGNPSIVSTSLRDDGIQGGTNFYNDSTTRVGQFTCYNATPTSPWTVKGDLSIILGVHFPTVSDNFNFFDFYSGTITLTT
jgi:hypothetical protein